MPSRRRRKGRRGAGVTATKSDIQTYLEKIPGTECVQDFLSSLSSKEFSNLMKIYVKPLQKGGRRRTRKRRGGQPGAFNTPECGRCLPVCRCGNANKSPECRKCVMSGRSMSSSRRTRKQSQKRYGIQRIGIRGNGAPEYEPRRSAAENRRGRLGPQPDQDLIGGQCGPCECIGTRAFQDCPGGKRACSVPADGVPCKPKQKPKHSEPQTPGGDFCAPDHARCRVKGGKSCAKAKECDAQVMAEIERLAKEKLDAGGEGAGGENWRGHGRPGHHTGPKNIPPDLAEASSFAQGLLDRIPDSVRQLHSPSLMIGIIATIIVSHLWKKCRRRRRAGGNGGDDGNDGNDSDGDSSGGQTIYPDDNNASSGASDATMGGRRRSRRRRSRRRRRTRRRRRRRRRRR